MSTSDHHHLYHSFMYFSGDTTPLAEDSVKKTLQSLEVLIKSEDVDEAGEKPIRWGWGGGGQPLGWDSFPGCELTDGFYGNMTFFLGGNISKFTLNIVQMGGKTHQLKDI